MDEGEVHRHHDVRGESTNQDYRDLPALSNVVERGDEGDGRFDRAQQARCEDPEILGLTPLSAVEHQCDDPKTDGKETIQPDHRVLSDDTEPGVAIERVLLPEGKILCIETWGLGVPLDLGNVNPHGNDKRAGSQQAIGNGL